jgi:hypothetical protein
MREIGPKPMRRSKDVQFSRATDRREEWSSTNAKPPLPLRYFFCANSLAASAAREKSKIDPAATSLFKLAVDRGVR